MYCPTCGSQNPDGAAFCSSCATRLQLDTDAALSRAVPPVQVPPIAFAQPSSAPSSGSSFDTRDALFMPRLLDYISHGVLFRRIVAGFLMAGMVVTIIAGLISAALGGYSYFRMGGVAILGGVLSIPLALVATYALAHILLIRARTVRDIPETEYTVIPIMSILLKLTGELGFVGAVFAGCQGLLSALFLSANPLGGLLGQYVGYGLFGGYGYGMGAAEAILIGFAFLTIAVVYGFVVLLFNYLLSELVVIAADIARDVRTLRHSQAKAAA